MSKPIQLRIPSPCHENWANMDPADKGRHCAACQKTVVDFTTMSDAEVIHYMAQAGSHVCGRLAPDQINRPIIPLAPPKKNHLAGWQVLLAGLLLTSDGSVPRSPASRDIHQKLSPTKKDGIADVTQGITLMSFKAVDSSEVVPVPEAGDVTVVDTVRTEMGSIAYVSFEPLPEPALPDSTQIQKGDSTLQSEEGSTMLEGILAESIGNIDSLKQTVTDSLKQVISDTLKALYFLPEKKLNIFPNPVPRGTAFHISWQTDPGTYQISLFNVSGALIQARIIEVSGPPQTDTWELPTSLSAGVYILRAIHPGQPGTYTGKLIIQ